MRNPWLDFDYQASSQLHPSDAPHVHAFNREIDKSPAKRNYKLSDIHAPLPYFGSLDAKVVILLANPGLSPNEIEPDESADQLALLDSARRHETKGNHFIYLDEGMKGTEGYNWWNLKLRGLLADSSLEAVHKNVLVLEFHPYHSVKFSYLPMTLPTQSYSFDLAKKKVQDGATFIMGRHQQGWFTAIPELAGTDSYFYKSRNAAVTLSNLSEGGYSKILHRLST